jgi:hypothetical protein
VGIMKELIKPTPHNNPEDVKRTLQHTFIPCEKLTSVAEDVNTIKVGLGYKEKSNGEFKSEVENENKSINTRMQDLELKMASLEGKMVIFIVLLTLLIGFLGAIVIELFHIL